MRSALIINGTGFTPCSAPCGSLPAMLREAHLFDAVHETAADSPALEHQSTPDLILLRFPQSEWKSLEACKTAWSPVKTLALLCGRNGPQKTDIPPALIDVDDFLVCPYRENELLIRLTRLFKSFPHVARSLLRRDGGGDQLDAVIGDGPVFRQTLHKVNLLARSKATVVISGETGSGKELLARAIHYQSARKSKPFIPVNCGALPDELFENELFGHVKGAYTHASSAEKGLIAEAHGGTLFLDEVDTLSHAAQVKLLRFLQRGEYRPLGSPRSMMADVRVISATNADLQRLVETRVFREDLLYRLNVLSLSVPPLRDRGDDILKLATHFLNVYAREQERETPSLSDAAIQQFLEYPWPGNVRELESVIQRAIVLQPASVLTTGDFSMEAVRPVTSDNAPFRKGKSLAIGQFERSFIAKLLAAHGGNISRAAKAAGKDRRSFQRLVSKYALDRKSFKKTDK